MPHGQHETVLLLRQDTCLKMEFALDFTLSRFQRVQEVVVVRVSDVAWYGTEAFRTFRGILPSESASCRQPRKAEPKRVVAALSTKPKEETWKHSACLLRKIKTNAQATSRVMAC